MIEEDGLVFCHNSGHAGKGLQTLVSSYMDSSNLPDGIISMYGTEERPPIWGGQHPLAEQNRSLQRRALQVFVNLYILKRAAWLLRNASFDFGQSR